MYAVKKIYHGSYRLLGGMEAWLRSDNEVQQVWTLEREDARAFPKAEAQRLLVESQRNRPDDTYALVALD